MRSGEANKLEWINIDTARRTITLNNPEKGGNPRIFKVSAKLINILNALPKKSQRVFGDSPVWHKGTFSKSRKRIAKNFRTRES
jgi:integrase